MGKKNCGVVVITNDLIDQIVNEQGELTRPQANVLCLDWPLRKGWRDRVVGRLLPGHKCTALRRFAEADKQSRQSINGKGPSGHTGYATVSKTLLKECVDAKGGLSQEQARILGLTWPLPNNWREMVLGNVISWAARHELPKLKKNNVARQEERNRPEWDLGARTLSYEERNKVLNEIGFPSYEAYLKSERWEKIRKLVFATKGHHCTRCGKDVAFQVHHSSYDKETLLGKSLDHLWPICGRCHQYIERDWRGRKQSLSDANSSLGLTRGATNHQPPNRSRQQST